MSYQPTPKQLARLQAFRNDIKTACVKHGLVLDGTVAGCIRVEGYDDGVLDKLCAAPTGKTLEREEGWDS